MLNPYRFRNCLRVFCGILLSIFAGTIFAGNGSVRLSCFPNIALADGRTTISVTAEVRTEAGSLVPDGTQVIFNSSLGTFRDSLVATTNGLARALLVTSSVPGIATLTASVLQFNANAKLDIEFVSDRSLLSRAREYIEVVAPKRLIYSPEYRVIEATGTDKPVSVRYKDVTVDAADVQVIVPSYEVIARKAKVKIGKEVRNFDEVNVKLNQRRAIGTTIYEGEVTQIVPASKWFGFQTTKKLRSGVVEMRSDGIVPVAAPVTPDKFAFRDLSEVVTIVTAKRVTANPIRDIQFQRAEIVVTGVTVLRLPLFQLSSNVTAPVITDQFLNVTNNQLAIDYPQYLTLRPGQTSLLRFRSGTRYSSGVGASGGTFLDYEMKWNRGEDSEGGLTISGIARKDWGLNLKHYLRLDDSSSATAQLDLPANRSLFGTFNINRSFGPLQANLSANISRSIRGPLFENQQYFLALDADPIKLGKLPLKLTLGAQASQSEYRNSGGRRVQSGMGFRARFNMQPQRFGRSASFDSSLSLAQFLGRNLNQRFAVSGVAAFRSALGRNANLMLTYEYLDDGFNSRLTGKHRLSAESFFSKGRLGLSASIGKSLDLDRFNVFSSLSYRIDNTWRLGLGYASDRYLGSSFNDLNMLIGYRIGFREVGLSYSTRTKRIGFELLGARF